MAIGRTFQQSFAKALRSRELDKPPCLTDTPEQELLASLAEPRPARYETILELLARGSAIEPIREATSIDPWFLRELQALALHPEEPFAGSRSFRSVDTCAAEFPARTPYYYSGWELRRTQVPRGRTGRSRVGRDPRRRAQPHRPGHRVRLLLRPRRHDRPRVRPRRGDGQLQPRDRLHRLRHLRPALLRAPDARGRAVGGRGRERRRQAEGRDRAVRRADAAEARRRPGRARRAAARHQRRVDRPGRGPRAASAPCSRSSA